MFPVVGIQIIGTYLILSMTSLQLQKFVVVKETCQIRSMAGCL